jgi:hypothetical protein
MAQTKLTMALSHYDRHIPFFDGSVTVENADLRVLEVGQSSPLKHGQDRHERMLQKGEFDVCELSLSNYLVAKSRGMPFTAIPVFPRRLFSLSQMWVNADARIYSPQELIGKKVGLSTFQTTLSVLARGDLQAEYGVSWREIDWYISKDEAVPLKPIEGVKMQLLKPGQKMGAMLERGEIDAIMMPHPPKEALRGGATIRRLFADAKAARGCIQGRSIEQEPTACPRRHGGFRSRQRNVHGLLRRSQLVALCLGAASVRRGTKSLRRGSVAARRRKESRQLGAFYRLLARSGTFGKKSHRRRTLRHGDAR